MISMPDWMPQGSDGASADALPALEIDHEALEMGTTAFRSMVSAIENNDAGSAQVVWEGLVDRVGDQVNPYALLMTVAVVCNAAILRLMAGDPNPFSPPTFLASVTILAVDTTTQTIVDLPLEEFATAAIAHAANWEWSELNDMVAERLRTEEDIDGFLHELTASLMSIFIGVGGSEKAGWRRK